MQRYDQNWKTNLSHDIWCNFKRQRNRCLQKTKKQYFFNIKQVSDNKLFWKSGKPFFGEKKFSKITLVEEKKLPITRKRLLIKWKNIFLNVTKSLILKNQITSGNDDGNDSYINIKMIHKKDPEIVPESFKFELVSGNDS